MAKNISADTNKQNVKKRTGRKWTRIATIAAAVTLWQQAVNWMAFLQM